MKAINICVFSVILIFASLALQGQGIKFEDGLSWDQIMEKAKAENRNIFVACFATWCRPCKAMDKDVYPLQVVGTFYNSKFISVKIQMDSTSRDNDEVKRWYSDAAKIGKQYKVNEFPTYLFFSPGGQPLHKAVGGQSKETFLVLANDAMNDNKQYFKIAKRFEGGRIDTSEMKEIAKSLIPTDKTLAQKIAVDYISKLSNEQLGQAANLHFMSLFHDNVRIQGLASKYIMQMKMSDYQRASVVDFLVNFQSVPAIKKTVDEYIVSLPSNLYNSKNTVELLVSFTSSIKEPGFKLLYNNCDKIDMIMGENGYAKKCIDNVILKTVIIPELLRISEKPGQTPNFDSLFAQIRYKYSEEFAHRSILKGKVRWYDYLKVRDSTYWNTYMKYKVEEIETFGLDTLSSYYPYEINNFAWYVFLRSDDPQILSKVLTWIEKFVPTYPESSNLKDTYANLLYKIGKRELALSWQKAACKQDPTDSLKIVNLQKMKAGIPTW
jgi:thioredoxin-related protein